MAKTNSDKNRKKNSSITDLLKAGQTIEKNTIQKDRRIIEIPEVSLETQIKEESKTEPKETNTTDEKNTEGKKVATSKKHQLDKKANTLTHDYVGEGFEKYLIKHMELNNNNTKIIRIDTDTVNRLAKVSAAETNINITHLANNILDWAIMLHKDEVIKIIKKGAKF